MVHRPFLLPRPLMPGGTIGVVSPAGPSGDGDIERAVAVLTGRGYGVVVADATRAVAVQEHPEQGGVEEGVDHPRPDAAAPVGHRPAEVHPHDPTLVLDCVS